MFNYGHTSKHVFSAGLAVFIATIIDFYFFPNSEYWLLLSAFLMTQAAKTAPLREGMICFFIMMMALFLSTGLREMASSFYFIYSSVSIAFIVCYYFLLTGSSSSVHFYFVIFFIIFLSSILMPGSSLQALPVRTIELMLGAATGFISRFFFPLKLDAEFSSGMVPVLTKLNEYSTSLTHFLIFKDNEHFLLEKKNALEIILNSSSDMYPEWVYAIGFNRGVREGLRYFLIQLERTMELWFAIQGLAFQKQDVPVDMQELFQTAMEKNRELLMILRHYFQKKDYGKIKSDFTEDIVRLENALQKILPKDLELLDVSSLYLWLIVLVKNIKDLRELLLQLVLALPHPHDERSYK